jgi:hypothetical protein
LVESLAEYSRKSHDKASSAANDDDEKKQIVGIFWTVVAPLTSHHRIASFEKAWQKSSDGASL